MKRLAYLIFFGSLSTTATISAAYQWPIAPFTQQHEILATVGDLRSTSGPLPAYSIHDGVDIIADAGTEVFPVASGYVSQVAPDQRLMVVNQYRYQLINPELLPVGWPVSIGATRLGIVVSVAQDAQAISMNENGMADHLHFSDSLNPLNAGLSPYVDNQNPTVSLAGVFKDVNPLFSLVAGTPFPQYLGTSIVFGQVNIKAQASDSAVSANGSGSGNMGVFSYGYQVLNQAGGLVAQSVPCTLNTPGGARPEMIYADPTTAAPSSYYYWVTNTCGAHTWWDSSSVPDGHYQIRAMVSDTQSGLNGRPTAIYSSPMTVIVDNHLPVISNATPPNGSSVGPANLTIGANLADNADGIDTATIRLDGVIVQIETQSPVAISCTPPSALAFGSHSVTVSASDHAGFVNQLSWTFTIVNDTTPPSIPVVFAANSIINDPTKLQAMWSSDDPETGISRYYVGIGTAPGSDATAPFTSFGSATSGWIYNLNLSMGSTYFINVYAVNGAGLSSPVGSSQGIYVKNSRPIAVADGPYGAYVSAPIVLDGSMSYDADGDTLTYHWSFGDGTPAGTGPKPSHIYSGVGNYRITLTVNDGFSDSAPSTSTVNVTNFVGLASTWTTVSDFSLGQSSNFVVAPVQNTFPDDGDLQLALGPETTIYDQPVHDTEFNQFTVLPCHDISGNSSQFFTRMNQFVGTTDGFIMTAVAPLMRRPGAPTLGRIEVGSSVGFFDTAEVGITYGYERVNLTPYAPVYPSFGAFINNVYNGVTDINRSYYIAASKTDVLANTSATFSVPPQWPDFNSCAGIPGPTFDWTFRIFGRQYAPQGQFISSALDAGTTNVAYGQFLADDSKPSGNTIQYFTQTSADDISWSATAAVTPGQFITSPPNRFIRWIAKPTIGNRAASPVIHNVIVVYRPLTPPSAPTQLTANGSDPSPWSNHTSFTITLSTPVHTAGIAGAHFKAGNPPASNSEGVYVSGVTSFQYVAPSLTEGANPLYVWLQDGLGNASTNYTSVVYLRFDSVPPISSAVAPATAAAGPFPVGFNSTDVGTNAIPPTGSGVANTFLWFRRDHSGDGIFSAWQKVVNGVSAGGVAESTGTFSFDPVTYDSMSPDGIYQFYTQSVDVAGNVEAPPAPTSAGKAATNFDRTPAVISNVSTPSIMPTTALVQWNTDDMASGYVEYGTTTAFGFRVNVSTPARSQLAALNCHLLFPATIYYRITAVNLTQLTTVSSTLALTTPIQVTIPTDPFGVVTNGNPIVIQIDNPNVSTGTFDINGVMGSITVSSSGVFTITISSSATGTQTLNINLGGYIFSTTFIVDTATRAVRLARFVADSGGVMTSTAATPGTSMLDMSAGQVVQGPPTDHVASGAFTSGQTRMFGGYYAGIDPVPPGTILNLGVIPGPGKGQATLSWTAVGDDANVGQAMLYDLRFSTTLISDANFALSTAVVLSTYPAAAGTAQQAIVGGLGDATTYYFALKTLDEALNAATLSNVAVAETYAVAQSTSLTGGKPTVSLISNVTGIAIDQVSTTTFNPSVVLATSAAAAQGLVFASPVYDILSPVNPLPGGATIQFRFDPTGLDPTLQQQLRIYHFISSQNAWVLLSDVPPIANDNLLVADAVSFSMYAIMLRDRIPPITSVNYLNGRHFVGSGGSVFVSTATSYQLSANDPPVGPRPGTGVAVTKYRVDSTTAAFLVWNSTTLALQFSPGFHALEYFSSDYSGNVESTKNASISVDSAPPTAQLKASTGSYALLSDGISMPTQTLFVALHDPLLPGGNLDAGSGISTAAFALDGSSFAVSGSSFSLTLTTGTHYLEIVAIDNVGNILDRSSSSAQGPLRVLVGGDSLPPRTSFLPGVPSMSSSTIYATNLTAFSLTAVDDLLSVGDGAGLGISQTYLALDTTTFNLYPGTFSFSNEGLHSASFFSIDLTSHTESSQTVTVAIDTTPPITSLQEIGLSTTDAQGTIFITSTTQLALSAVDPLSSGVASGLGAVYYVIDANPFDPACDNVLPDASQPSGTCANESYNGPFNLSPGLHTVYYFSEDNLINQENLHAASVMVMGPAAIQNLAANNLVYRSIQLSWTAPGELNYFGQALSYDLRFATTPITADNFSSATAISGLAAPLPGESPSSFTVTGVNPGTFYYFAIKTTNHVGQVSALSNVASIYSGDYDVALDPAGQMWELDVYRSYAMFGRFKTDGSSRFLTTVFLPWQPRSSAVGFDGAGDGYAVFTPTAPANGPGQNVAVYETSSDGVFIASRTYAFTTGQPAALNQAPYLEHAAAADSDGAELWIAGAGSGSAGLWKADASGLTLVGLTAGATAQTVLANGSGAVWMAGINNGEFVLWRYDAASGDMRHYGWTNTLGGIGSEGRAIVEDAAGGAWVAGWANTATGRVAALWQWNGSAVNLVATSTGVFSDQALGLDLDAAGRFWLAGRAQTDSAGTLNLALWQYPASGGSSLIQTDAFTDFPQLPAFNVGRALSLADGKIWALNGPAPYGVHSRVLGLGNLAGKVNYSGGFTGGNVAFFTSNHPDFNDNVSFYGLLPAPSSGTVFNYTLAGLPSPATYYVAAAYDLSGSAAATGQPGAGDPIGIALTPTALAAGATAGVPNINLAVDHQAPTLAILSPLAGSTIPAAAFAISGTAADDTGIGDLKLGLQNLANGTWWDEQTSSFVVSGVPLITMNPIRSGPTNNLAWAANAGPIVPLLVPGGAYHIFAQVSDISGHSVSVSAPVVIMSTTNPVEPGYALAFSRDNAGSLWTVTQDFIIQKSTGAAIPVGITLRKYDSAGTFLSTTSLPGASGNGGTYGIAFDPSGNAWVGGATDAGGGNVNLTLWKVSAANDVLFGTATVAAPSGGSIYNGGIAVDAAGNAWVSGAEQTSPMNFAFRFGLWKFDPFGTLTQTVYYQRPGGAVDGGFATAVDASGNVWSAGISSNPATGLLDLALWKYNSAGNLVSVSSRPAAFLSVNNTGLGLTVNPAGGVWVAASQAYPQWGVSDLALLRYGADGVLISSALWHGAGIVQGRGVALDPAGNPWVAGIPAPSVSAIWKYSASGTLAQGYPKRDSPDFDDVGLVVDPAGTVWASYAGEPFVFSGTTTVAGAPGISPWSFAGYSSLSGTLRYPAGFVAGSTVTVVVSSTNFVGDPQIFPFTAPGGTSLSYSVSLVAPGAYAIGAFVGADPNQLTPASPAGFYNHFAAVPLSTGTPTTGVDFALALDTVPPTSVFNGIVDGSTIAALANIQGTAQDNLAFIGTIRLSALDLNNGLWWDAHKQDWVASTVPVYATLDAVTGAGPLDSRDWKVNAAAVEFLGSKSAFGGFSDFLPHGHRFQLLVKAVDLVGNVQSTSTAAAFTWLGADGASGPPSKVSNLTVVTMSATSITVSWNATGEHQNIGTAASYDLRVATFSITETNADSATAVLGVPAPQLSGTPMSSVVGGLTPGKRYYVALRVANHEGSLSPLSNVVAASIPLPGSTPRTALIAGQPNFSTITVYATDVTTFGLVAADDLLSIGDNAGPGIARTFIAVDTTTFGMYSGTFTLAGEGAHTVSYYSVDLATHTEAAQFTTVNLDLTSPITALHVMGSSATDAHGGLVIASGTALALAAIDPNSRGVASGLAHTFLAIDSTTFTPYPGTFSLVAPGTHTISFFSVDRVGNAEVARSTQVTVDAAPPLTTLLVNGLPAATTSLALISTDTIGFAAVDAGAGVFSTLYSLDGTTQTVFASTFSLSIGTHTLSYHSLDAVGNVENVKAAALSIAAPIYMAGSADGVVTLFSQVSGETITAVSVASQTAAIAAAAGQGLTAATSFYDLSPSGILFIPPARLLFRFDPGAASTSTLAIYTFNGVSWDSAAIAGQQFVSLSSSSAQLSGTLAHASLYALLSTQGGVSTATPTVTGINPNTGGNVGSLTVTVTGTNFAGGATLELQRAAASPGFNPTGSFPSFQSSAQAIRLPNGKVLYIGGDSYSAILATSYLYDPAAGTWSQTGSMSAPRKFHQAVLLQNGKVLAVGGTSAGAGVNPLASAELYDPVSGAWSPTGSLHVAREFPMTVALADGRVLVAGGIGTSESSVSSAEIYDPASGTWSFTGFPHVPHDRAQGVLLQNGKVLMAGGRNASGQFTADVELFDPASMTWSTTGSLSGPKQTFAMTLLADGRVLVAGGDNGGYLSSAEIYSPTAGIWSATGAMTRIHVGAVGVTLPGGKVLVVGGSNGQGMAVQEADLYDPASGAWSSPGAFQAYYLNNTATMLNGGFVLIAGGIDATGTGAVLYGPASFDIFASSVNVLSSMQLTGSFDLSGQPAGLWNVLVTNTGGAAGALNNGFTIHDTVPPSAAGDLSFAEVDASSATLRWTAPSSPSGALASYDLRYASFPITTANFASATSILAPVPGASGASQTASVQIASGLTFFAALKSMDVYGNVSALSNVASLARSAVTVDGASELAFYAGQPISATLLSTTAAPGSTALTAAASQQLTLASSLYDLGPEGVPFSPNAVLVFRYSLPALSALGLTPADIKIYQFIAGTGLVAASSQTLSTAAQTVTAPISALSSVFGLFAPVLIPSVTAISPNSGPSNAAVNVTVSGSNFMNGATFRLHQQAAGSAGFTLTGPFPSFQASGQAVRLPNGKVLYVGGDGYSSILATSYLYDPAAGTWSPTGSMSAPRKFHQAVLLQNGKVLVVGGTSAGAGVNPLASAELYDPASGTWSPTGSLNVAREFPMTVALADGRVLVTGGIGANEPSVSSAEIYDPASGTWSFTGFPHVPHDRAQGVLLQNGKVLMAGGRNASGQFTADVELFDPASMTWSTTGSLSGPKQTFAMTLLADGRVLVAGGDNGGYLSSAEIYSSSAGIWSATGAMTNIRVGAVGVTMPGGKVLVVGGTNGQGMAVQAADLYDPAGGTWSSPGTIQADYFNNTATLLNSGLVLIAGGIDATGTGTVLFGAASYDIPASSVVVISPTQMTGALNLAGKPLGLWGVVATNPNSQSGSLANGFTILNATPPNAVSDLTISAVNTSSVTLRWTTPPSTNPLFSYDLRRATFPITAANFTAAISVPAPAPASSGTVQSIDVTSVVESTFYAAIVSHDGFGGVSPLSNVAGLTRSTVIVNGSPELAFSANQPVTGTVLSTAAGKGAVVLASATTSGLILVSSIYDLGPEGAIFNPAATLTIRYSTAALAAAGLAPTDLLIYQYVTGTGWVAVSTQTLSASAQTVTAAVPSLASIFALLGKSHVPPSLALTPISGGTVTTPTPRIVAAYSAIGPGVSASTVRLALDGTDVTALASVTASSASFAPAAALAQGTHTVTAAVADYAGNIATATATFLLDSIPPQTTLVAGIPQFSSTTLFVAPTTPLGLTVSESARTFFAVDSSTFAAYSGSFTLVALGTHTVQFYSIDVAGNVEMTRTAAVAADGLPPRTAVAFGDPKFVGAQLFLNSATPVQFAATDDLAVASDGHGAGVAQTLLSVDSAPFAAVASAVSLSSEGMHVMSWFSRDLVGNAEVAASTIVAVDLTPPFTQLLISTPSVAQSSGTVVGPGTILSLAAQDTLSGGVASGVKDTFLAISTNVFALAPATFTLSGADGPRAVSFYSRDNVLNTEAVKTVAVLLDATPPLTVLQILGGRRFPGPDAASEYVSPDTRFAFAAQDPTVGGVSAGVAFTQSSDNGGAFLASTTTFTLAEGRHALAYQSQDLVGNMEVTRSTTMLVDATPPVSTATIGAPLFTAADGTIYIGTATPVALSAADPALPQISTGAAVPGSGMARIEVSVDSAAFAVYTASLTFAEGRHTIQYRAIDNVGNVEAARTLAVQSDATPPLTAPVLAGGRQATGAGGTFVSSDTRVGFAAADPSVNGVASGVAFTRWQDNGGAFSAFVSSFALAEGSHTLTFQSQDNVGNLEVLKSTAILVDATPPVSTAVIGAPLYVAADGTQYVTPTSPVTLAAADPVVNGVASGLDHIEIAVDGSPFTTYVSTLTFAEGRHTVQYRAVDRVGNVEAARTLRLQSDGTPPVTALQASGSYFAAAGRNYAPLSFNYALPAQDPVVNGVASGVAATLLRVDASSFTRYVSTFSLTEGVRRVNFQSTDNVGNQELLKSATVYVDATAPVTALTIGQPQYAALGGLLFVGPAAPFALSAQDPVVQGVASGVNAISVRVASAPFSFYIATFTLTPGDGLRTVGWFSADNVGNAEAPKVSTVALDATPPLTTLLVTGGSQFPGPDASTFYASADTRLALISTDPLAGGVASGVAFTRWQDNNGTFATYISSLTLAEGAHKLGYQSQDNVANLEVLRSTNAWIDATPPAATVAIGSPTFTAADGTIYVATATPVAFAAADPNLPTGQPGSGLNRIEVSLDGAPFTPYTAALTLAEGRHVILYRAVDNVGNVEGAHSISIQSDATPPVSSLVIGQPQFQLPNVLLVSSRTSFSIAAIDPVTNNVASGVKDTYYRVSDVAPSTAAFALSTAPFVMAGTDVNKVVEFYSRDNVLNAEVVKSSTVLLDSTPPEVVLLSPAACDSGICRVLKGKFPVLGIARDLHFGNYRLEFAAGQNAISSFTFVSSGTAAVSSGPLGVWDATALAGWITLRLTATDLVLNSASVAINVFAGDPGELLTLGNHEVFNMPEGVAAGADGRIYVADRDNDRVAVFSSTGTLLASFGSRGHDDDHSLSTGTLRLDEPSGVAVDAAGNIYVADTDHDRVLKLSATGQILLSLGGREREHEDRHDDRPEDHDRRLPGRFHHPAGVAVDSAQNIFVADTDNHRVQVFNSTGGFSFQFDMPLVPARPDHDDNDRHDDHDDDSKIAALGKPFGIALDAAGDIYVADSKGGRALKFGATGQLLLTIPIIGDKPGSLGQPFGVAVSTSGDCLLVSDRKSSRVLKFDFLGNQNLSFGTKGKVHDDDAPAPRGAIVFNKPMGLAMDGQGNLLVADRNNDRVRKFALPTGQPPLVIPMTKPEDEHVARDVVDTEDGGKVERKDLASVAIPAGAVAQDMKVTVSTPSAGSVDESNRRHAVDAAQLKTASPPVEYGPEGTKFAAPVTLTLPYSPDLVALEGVDEADLTVRYWNRDKAQWENLDSTVDPKTHTVKAKTTHFSLYQVFSGTASAEGLRPLAVGDPTFMFHDAYAFPNPVRGVNAATIRIQPGLADSVEVHVYDLAGRRVYSSSNFSLNTGLDDGNGKGVQYTYDNVWDISGVGSGVYQYVLTAKKSGQSDIHKAGRIAVVK